jgi:hypothetical protein
MSSILPQSPSLTLPALNGSKHIEFLLQHNLIIRNPSDELFRVYSRALLWASAKRLDPKALKQYVKITFTVGEEKEEEIQLLEQTNGKAVAKVLKIPELAAEIERAVKQVELSVKASEELKGEKKRLESAKKEQASGAKEPQQRPKDVKKVEEAKEKKGKDRPKRRDFDR